MADLDQDGHGDLLAVVGGQCTGTAGGLRGAHGYAWAVSGRTGALLREFESATPTSQILSMTGAGDFDGDGIQDIATAEWDPYGPAWWNSPTLLVAVHSGSGGTIAMWPSIGTTSIVLGDLDLNGDQRPDLVVADRNWGPQGTGELWAYDNSGALLYTLYGPATPGSQMTIGACLAKLGDVNGDGRDDFVMGCYDASTRGAGVVVSGANGSFLQTCYGELPYDWLGYSVDSAGDLDGDGVQDFVLGNGGAFGTGRSVVRTFSTRTGQALHQWTAPYPDYGRTVACRGGDLDGDGLPDVVAGTPWDLVPPSRLGAVYGYSGRDGARLHRVTPWVYPPSPNAPAGSASNIGVFVTVLKPPDDVAWMVVVDRLGPIVNGGTTCGYAAGAIRAFRGLPTTASLLGAACTGNLAAPPGIGMRSFGTTGVRVHLSAAPPGSPAILLVGLSTSVFLGVPLPASLDPLGFPGCHLRTSIEVTHLTTTGGTGTSAGYASVDMPLPVLGMQGVHGVSAQWLVLGTGATFPGGLSEALTWRH